MNERMKDIIGTVSALYLLVLFARRADGPFEIIATAVFWTACVFYFTAKLKTRRKGEHEPNDIEVGEAGTPRQP